MDGLAAIFAIGIYLIPPLLFAWGGQHMAKGRGRHEVGWAIACFFTGFVGIIILAIVGDTDLVKAQKTAAIARQTADLINRQPMVSDPNKPTNKPF